LENNAIRSGKDHGDGALIGNKEKAGGGARCARVQSSDGVNKIFGGKVTVKSQIVLMDRLNEDGPTSFSFLEGL